MLNPVFLNARDIPDAWYQLLRAAVERGREYTVTQGSTPTKRWEIDFASVQISHPGTRPLTPDIPVHIGIPNPVDPEYVENYLPYYMTDISQPREHYTYGQDLAWQIEWVIDYYKKFGPGNKHCYMTVGRPESLFFYDEDLDYHEEIELKDRATGKPVRQRTIDNGFNRKEPGTTQCLRGVDTAIKYGKLHFSIHFRSWNLWNGLPANLACLQMVKEYMADQIGVEDGEMFITCLKLGLEESVFDIAKLRLYLSDRETSRG
jgi:thymidylate synthase